MKRDLVTKKKSSFQSCDRDTEIILRKLFVESEPLSTDLKKLLIIPHKDCLDSKYNEVVKNKKIKDLINEGYITISPANYKKEHEQIKATLMITFDGFMPSENTEFRDSIISFGVFTDSTIWNLDNFKQRPLAIMGIVDGILNKEKLTGIGELNFLGADFQDLDVDFMGYMMLYQAIHGSDDKISAEEALNND